MSPLPSRRTHIFVYGTLLVPAIWRAVTGSEHRSWIAGSLAGHRLRRVRGADFPGIVVSEHADGASESVPGRVALDVDAECLARLDAYEDGFYRRERVSVATADGPLEAEAYRIPPEDAPAILGDEPWTLEWFEATALGRYLESLA